MPGFYYWFPETLQTLVDESAGKLRPEALAAYGCEYLIKDREVYPDQTCVARCEGPRGAGVLVYPKPVDRKEPLPRCVYSPDDQDWVPFRGYWIGCEKGHLPRPVDLERKQLTSWYDIEDSQGQNWKVPIVRRREGMKILLPTVNTFDEAGNFVSRLEPGYQSIWELGGLAVDMMLRKREHTDEEINRMAVQFLGVNYYVGIAEIHAWGTLGKIFLNDTFVAGVFGAVTDWVRVEDYEEKKTNP